jgi:hypothetical protein
MMTSQYIKALRAEEISLQGFCVLISCFSCAGPAYQRKKTTPQRFFAGAVGAQG